MGKPCPVCMCTRWNDPDVKPFRVMLVVHLHNYIHKEC